MRFKHSLGVLEKACGDEARYHRFARRLVLALPGAIGGSLQAR